MTSPNGKKSIFKALCFFVLMSFLKSRPFQHAEDTIETKKKIRKMVNNIRRRTPRTAGKQWYYAGIAANRTEFSKALAHKNEPTLPRLPRYRSLFTEDGFRRRDDVDTDRGDPVDIFVDTAKSSDDIRFIPGMTVGLEYVLRLLDIDTIAQMLAKLLLLVDGVHDATLDVLDAYFEWLTKMSAGTIASETNMHTIVSAMGQYAMRVGVLEYEEL